MSGRGVWRVREMEGVCGVCVCVFERDGGVCGVCVACERDLGVCGVCGRGMCVGRGCTCMRQRRV